MSDPNQVVRVDLIQGPPGIPGTASTVPGPAPTTLTTAAFTQPAQNATVTIQVASSVFWAVDQAVFVATAGDYLVTAVPDATHLTLLNLSTPGSAQPGTVIASGVVVTCNGLPSAGSEALLTTTNATPAAINIDLSWVAPLTTFRLDVVVVARSTADDVAFTLSGLFRKAPNGAISATSSVQLPAGFLSSTGALAWTGSLAPGAGSSVDITLVGAAGTTIAWATLAQLVRVTGLT